MLSLSRNVGQVLIIKETIYLKLISLNDVRAVFKITGGGFDQEELCEIGGFFKLDDEIKVIVISVRGGQARIGIDAPVNIKINREEIHLRNNGENQHSKFLKQSVFTKVMNSFRT
jgi:carbon storage regulator CsrA